MTRSPPTSGPSSTGRAATDAVGGDHIDDPAGAVGDDGGVGHQQGAIGPARGKAQVAEHAGLQEAVRVGHDGAQPGSCPAPVLIALSTKSSVPAWR